MTHTIIYNPETHTVEIGLQGDIYFEEIKLMYSQALQTAKDNDTFLFLSDFREAAIRLSTMEIYQLPRLLADITASIGLSPYKLKRAIISSQRLEDFHFYETVSSNRGQSPVKIFQDAEEAKKWLAEK